MNIFSIFALILGSIVGAGFSTGQEVYFFFSQYEGFSVILILITCILIYLGLKAFSKFKINVPNKIFRLYILFFSWTSLIVMFSAIGQIGEQYLSIKKGIFIIICFITSALIYKQGLTGIASVNKIVVVFLIIIIVILSITKINNNILYSNLNMKVFEGLKSSLLYASFNCFLCLPVILKIKEKVRLKEFFLGLKMSIFALFSLLILINFAILSNKDSFTSSMPILFISSGIMKKIILITTSLEILTTILSNYIGIKITSGKYYWIFILSSLLLGLIEFRTILRTIYTILGFIGIPIYIYYLYKVLSHKINNNNYNSK